jgi:hypothetical protein
VVVTAAVLFGGALAPSAPLARAAGSRRLPPGERQALAEAHAYGRRPVRFLLLGDSLALTLGVGLGERSVRRYGVTISDQGTLGCDLDDLPVRLSGGAGPATPGCLQWRTAWSHEVAAYAPDVVGLLIGRWEVSDHLFRGRWVHVGQSAWDAHLVVELDEAITLCRSEGATVVLFTMPYVDPPAKAATGKPFSENQPSRVRAFNALLRRVASDHRSQVTVIALNRQLDPSGHFQAAVKGLTVRWPDGIHITAAGGAWLQPSILPIVARVGLAAVPRVDVDRQGRRRASGPGPR